MPPTANQHQRRYTGLWIGGEYAPKLQHCASGQSFTTMRWLQTAAESRSALQEPQPSPFLKRHIMPLIKPT
jgi:hypothetical protein